MNALKMPATEKECIKTTNHLHLVVPGEVSANFRRKAYARQVARLRGRTAVRTYTALGSVIAVIGLAYATMWSVFVAIPNTPMP